jgi:glycosyltransferase involved in cell wall biosynthesis
LVALEAMASGVPVIATKVGGVTEVLDDERTALLVPPDQHEMLARALVRLLEDHRLREMLTVNGLCTAREQSWNSVIDRYESLYEYVGSCQ